jgi:hypothetical protein
MNLKSRVRVPASHAAFFVLSVFLMPWARAQAAAADPCQRVDQIAGMSSAERKAKLASLNVKALDELIAQSKLCRERADAALAKVKMNAASDADKATAQQGASSQKVEEEAGAARNEQIGLDGFKFAVGIGRIDLRGRPDITGAVVDQGVVRVTGEERYKLGMWVSTNTYFGSFGMPWGEAGRFRAGAFMGAQLGDNDRIVNSFAVGLSLTTRKAQAQIKAPGAEGAGSAGGSGEAPLVFQVGRAWTRTNALPNGYVEGSAPPGSATQVPLKKTTQRGLVLMVSYTLN